MVIVRDGKEIELTHKEVIAAWTEREIALQKRQHEVDKDIVKDLAEKNDIHLTEDEISDVADECRRSINKYGCDPEWVFGDGFIECVLDADVEIKD